MPEPTWSYETQCYRWLQFVDNCGDTFTIRSDYIVYVRPFGFGGIDEDEAYDGEHTQIGLAPDPHKNVHMIRGSDDEVLDKLGRVHEEAGHA